MGSEGGVWKNADAASLPSGDRGQLFPWRAVGCQGGSQVDSEYTAEEEAVGPGDAGIRRGRDGRRPRDSPRGRLQRFAPEEGENWDHGRAAVGTQGARLIPFQ